MFPPRQHPPPGAGLHRALTSAQLSMIAIGGAIGTGLFLGSGFAIQLAGPAVLVSYGIAGAIALALAACLAELTVADPLPGGFGAQAERWLGPLAGSVTRWSYWSCVVLAVGTEVTAVAIYLRLWFPAVPGSIWIGGCSAVLVALNCADVRWFGRVEYGFAALKIAAIGAFVLLGAVVIARNGTGLAHWTDAGGFAPHGAWGIWSAVIVAIFSYLSIEMIAIAAGEAAEPRVAVVRAFRATGARLLLFYGGSLAVTLAIVPWRTAGTAESPFVTVARATGIPYAGGAINLVVLVAALSAMNSQLYAAGRMLWSLAEAGDAPRGLAHVSAAGAPVRAVLLSSGGAGLAAVLVTLAPEQALGAMVALSVAGALTAWGMIFATHHAFRRAGAARAFRVPGGRGLGAAGVAAIAAVLATTPFQPAFRWTLAWGLPFVALVVAAHHARLRGRGRRGYGRGSVPGERDGAPSGGRGEG